MLTPSASHCEELGAAFATPKQPIEEEIMAIGVRDHSCGHSISYPLVGDSVPGVRACGSTPNAFDLHSAVPSAKNSGGLLNEKVGALLSKASEEKLVTAEPQPACRKVSLAVVATAPAQAVRGRSLAARFFWAQSGDQWQTTLREPQAPRAGET